MAPQIKYPFSHLADVNAPYRDQIAEALLRVLDSGYYIGGPELSNFEAALASAMHAPHAVGVTNGLDALRLIFRAYLELGRLHAGDEVIVPANTYVASVLAVTDNGLTPVFVEPDATTLNLDTGRIEAAITERTRAILPVHLYGRVCWDNTLADVARRHNLIVVEDNAQAIGAEADCDGLFASRNTGALGHAGAFSFYPTKNIGALGDGGAVVTNDAALADAIRAIRNYGSDRQYHNIYKGLNCRLDPMKAAVLTIKLEHLQAENQLRRDRAAVYNAEINNPAVCKPQWLPDNRHVWHQYIVRVDDRDTFRKYLLENGVETAVHYATPPHRQPCYAEYAGLRLPITDEIARTVVSLPITRTTTLDDARAIAAIINNRVN
jgi:dTDP-4-amino-4,6-dideoxygalactose transaminase